MAELNLFAHYCVVGRERRLGFCWLFLLLAELNPGHAQVTDSFFQGLFYVFFFFKKIKVTPMAYTHMRASPIQKHWLNKMIFSSIPWILVSIVGWCSMRVCSRKLPKVPVRFMHDKKTKTTGVESKRKQTSQQRNKKEHKHLCKWLC